MDTDMIKGVDGEAEFYSLDDAAEMTNASGLHYRTVPPNVLMVADEADSFGNLGIAPNDYPVNDKYFSPTWKHGLLTAILKLARIGVVDPVKHFLFEEEATEQVVFGILSLQNNLKLGNSKNLFLCSSFF